MVHAGIREMIVKDRSTDWAKGAHPAGQATTQIAVLARETSRPAYRSMSVPFLRKKIPGRASARDPVDTLSTCQGQRHFNQSRQCPVNATGNNTPQSHVDRHGARLAADGRNSGRKRGGVSKDEVPST